MKKKIQFIKKLPSFYLRCLDCDKKLGVLMDTNIQEGWVLCIQCLNMRINKGEVEEHPGGRF